MKSMRTPVLIIQGARDSFGSRAEVETYELSQQISIAWIDDGDHSFKAPKRTGKSEADVMNELADTFVQWADKWRTTG